jgi:hypothetical protein
MRAHGRVSWRYSHFAKATNVTVLGKRMPDEIFRVELLSATEGSINR